MQILLVEDNNTDRNLVIAFSKMFQFIETTYSQANNLADAIHFLEKNKVEVILLDLNLPDVKGLDGLKQLKSNSNAGIVLINNHTDIKLTKKALHMGAQDFLTKDSLTPEALEKSIMYARERNKLDIQLREANQTKDKLFSILSHDLRSPLNSIISIINYINEDKENITKEELELMLNSQALVANSMLSLVNNLLNWSRIKIGTLKVELKEINVEKLLQDELNLFSQAAKNKDLKIVVKNEFEGACISDENIVETILRNLISNAIKFSNGGDTISIVIEKEKGQCCFIIKDEGIGMPPEIKNNLFNIEKRTGRPGTSDEPSSGLGLFLVKEMVDLLNGTISIESEENKGTVIKVCFPTI